MLMDNEYVMRRRSVTPMHDYLYVQIINRTNGCKLSEQLMTYLVRTGVNIMNDLLIIDL